ncbi:MAG: trypsin-like peptidase domain-containing protein, partial [Proteobacteria bacterium]|nr:trypsin-like peptidase domain-containing protein [Burkholderiales bacterium]
PLLPATGSYAEAAGRSMPSVVNIYTTTAPSRRERNPIVEDPFFQFFFGDRMPGGRGEGQGQAPGRNPGPGQGQQRPQSLGSGVIVNAQGYIVTNAHVVEAASQIEVALADGRRAQATVVGADPDTDLAVIRVELPDLPAITLGSTARMRVGDVVLAIGNPFGVGQTVTMGIVSALGRNQLGVSAFENFVQTDAAINPGNSGGALIDTQGNLIGINTLIFSRSGGSQGIGFAIPSETVREVMDQLIGSGTVTRGWLGVETQDLNAKLVESFGLSGTSGALVSALVRGGPAEDGGVRPGDVLIAIEGKPIANSSALLNSIAALKPGSIAAVTLLRERKEVKLSVKIGTRPTRKRA